MRRPMLIFGFVFAFSLFLIGFYGKAVLYAALPLAVAGFCIAVAVKRTRSTAVFPTAFLAVILACGVFFCTDRLSYAPAAASCGEGLTVRGVLVDVPDERDGKFLYTIKTSEIGGKKSAAKLVFSSKMKLDIDFYDVVTLTGATVYAPEEDSAQMLLNYKSRGIFLRAYSFYPVSVSPGTQKPPLYYVLKLRSELTQRVLNALPENEGGVAAAMLLGLRSHISDELYDSYKICGAVHLLAVSGLHTSLWSLLVYRFLLLLFKRRQISAGVSMVFLVFFIALTGFSASACRAGIMLCVVYLGDFFKREADALNSLGLSLTVIAALNPYSVMGLSLILSALSTAGILTASNRFDMRVRLPEEAGRLRALNGILTYIKETLIMTGAATVFTLPVLILFLGNISLVSPIVNVLVLYFASTSMLFGGLAAVLSPLSFVSAPLFLVCGLLIKSVNYTVTLFASLPFASAFVYYTYIKIWLAATLMLVAGVIFLNRRSKITLRFSALLSVCVLLFSSSLFYTVNKNGIKLCVVDVGNGTAVVLKNGIRTALIGCGGDYYAAGSICSQLRSSYSETDLLLVPRDESTESSAYPELCSKINADTKLVSSDFYGSLLHRSGEKAVDSASLTLWDKVLIEYTDSDSLCAAYVSINGCGVLISFMPANDISQMPQKWQDASILVCRQALPEGARDYGFPAIIISGDEEKGFSSYKNYLAEDIGNAYLTAEHGDIEITNLSAKSFTVWSEF